MTTQRYKPLSPILVINVYFPCDPRSANHDFVELIELLGDLESLIKNVDLTNVLLAGDLNCHFNRNSNFTTIVQNWLNESNLQILWSHEDERIEPVDFTFCNASSEPITFSTIDHFAVSQRMLNGLVSAGVIHDGSNLLNHSPIYVKFEVAKIDIKTQDYSTSSKVAWGLASEEAKKLFKDTFDEKLRSIDFPCTCSDYGCESEYHREHLEDYTISVLEAMEAAGAECLPYTSTCTNKKKRSKVLPGWTEYIQPYADESKFWYSLWTSAGKPCQGELFSIMK